MKDKRFLKMLDYILINEGGECNIKEDRGGHTNFGITQLTYDKWREDEELPKRSVSEITKDEVEYIYFVYYNESKANLIDDFGLACYLFDLTVNCGSRRAGILLQKALRACGMTLTIDGIIGNVTIKFANAMCQPALLLNLIKQRELFYENLVKNDPKLAKFLKGWLNRASKRYTE